MRKSDGREEERQGEHGVELNAEGKDVALPSRMSWQGVNMESLVRINSEDRVQHFATSMA